MAGKPKNKLGGQTFGLWYATGETARINKQTYWKCICKCGTERFVMGATLKNGTSTCCGCIGDANTPVRFTIHGKCNTKIYRIWNTMVDRCHRPKNVNYKNYGGRGIKVCARWRQFKFFLEDMGDTYKEGLSLDRREVNGMYEKSNCRWVPMKVQQRNRRNNHWITIDGETKTIAEWGELKGIPQKTIATRIYRGMNEVEAVLTPYVRK